MPKFDHKRSNKKWTAAWEKESVYEPKLKGAGKNKKFYNLMMFPYPSAEGLHVGNMYAFVGSDVYGRYKRMQGLDVFEPIGLDGFGIHSENYALKVGTHPAKQSKVSEKRFYKQLQMIGNGFAWNERLETYDPDYYQWTQWIFVQMWKAGLAYRKKQAVNWCPSCKTVLADEQVIAGKCERCGTVVLKRDLEQWFFRITKYAEKLLRNLDKLDWSEKVKIAQRNWIGKSEGALIKFPISNFKSPIEVFTTRPDTIFGATYLVLSPEHYLLSELHFENDREVKAYVSAAKLKSEEERIAEGGEKTGVELKGTLARNPATGEDIPVWVADYVLGGYGTGAIMAVPAHDERDLEFARKFNLPVREVNKHGKLIGSGKYDGWEEGPAAKAIAKEFGVWKTQYRLRDWLISRQRYWGAPIPMIFCPSCAASGKGERKDMPGWYAEKEKNLPVKLPFVKDFRPKGKNESPLASARSFYETKCPACKSKARRETDVSDTFLDSAWYYLRYPNVKEKKRPWDPAVIKKWFPVDMYIGGAEHSVLHLLYVRFMTMVLKDLKQVPFEEPFPKFRAHGLLIKEGAKMSKSKGNVVNPDEYIEKFGADVLRMYLMFLAPFQDGGDFRDQSILGVERFLNSVWKYLNSDIGRGPTPEKLKKILHKTIKKVSQDIEALKYNTAISQLMIFWNEAEAGKKDGLNLGPKEAEISLKLVAPFAPFMAEDIWRTIFRKKSSIHLEAWPKYDKKMVIEDSMRIAVQVNGKFRATIEFPKEAKEEEIKKMALSEAKIKSALEGREPKRVIYVAGRVVNIVI